jgi:AcrR family transcriptional regulator
MSNETSDQILDTAERLFSEHGLDAVSLRTLTAEAGVNLASVHYHFGSKEALVTAVFDRRVDLINRERLEMLDAVEEKASGGPLPLDDILRAFFLPAMRVSQQAGSTFLRLCGRMHAEPAEYVQRYFDEKFGPVIMRFVGAFARALPDLSVKERSWRLHFMAGALIFTLLEGEKVKRFSQGLCDPANVDEAVEHMVHFAAAGLRAPALARPDDRADEQKTEESISRPAVRPTDSASKLPPEEEEVTV